MFKIWQILQDEEDMPALEDNAADEDDTSRMEEVD